jgi:hypothetical protein
MKGDAMDAGRIDAVNALLVQAQEAHHEFEATELKGVYDQDWPGWYAAFAVEHGLGGLVGHAIDVDRLTRFLADSNADFEAAEPKPSEPWAAYTARRITTEL